MIPSSSSGIAAVGLSFNGFWHQDSSARLDNQHYVRWGVASPRKSAVHNYEWAIALFLFVDRKTTMTVPENGTLAPLVPPAIAELLSFRDGIVSQGFRLMRGCFAQEECSEQLQTFFASETKPFYRASSDGGYFAQEECSTQLQVRHCSVFVCRQRNDDRPSSSISRSNLALIP
uniref:Uncharacterized protein n=1 Tax=Nelumbo nucifera TaxID=4432 RepID=A0A822Z2N1_NELNU|nr:TPA_asm: hypothetical protein HUJ06_013085 [Nelumbo nucifera]